MNVLVVGSGGREHAICYSLHKSQHINQLFAIPGNPGIGQIATCLPIAVEDIDGILQCCKEHHIEFVVIGPEVPLCMGLADVLLSHGIQVFGPKKHAATLEGSKAFSKDFMIRHHIPTAAYKEVHTYQEAVQALADFNYPLVIKADGLAAGKGVVIVEDETSALETLDAFMNQGSMGDAGHVVVLEEFLTGFECSLLCFCDGKTIQPMVTCKDHKQIFDGNKGPNTGGMGTVSPNPFIEDSYFDSLKETILNPFVEGLKEDHMDYCGVIFIGLMIDENKQAKVLEFNVRFGDPETQSILARLDTDLFEVMQACANQTLADVQLKWKDEVVCTLVLSAPGYPGSYPKGLEIKNLDQVPQDIVVFHAGTKAENGKILTAGGRVLNLVASGKTLEEARRKVYEACDIIDFDGKYYRKDIGLN